MKKVSISIMAIPFRRANVEKIVSKIPEIPISVIYDTKSEGCWQTAKKAWRSMPPDATHHLVLQDDIDVCDNFYATVLKVVEANPKAIISLFASRFRAEEMADAQARGVSWMVRSRGLTAQAILMPRQYVIDFLYFCAMNIREGVWKPDQDDIRVRIWQNERKYPTWFTVPELVDHKSLLPSLHHHPSYASCCFARDASAVDWTKGLTDPKIYAGSPSEKKMFDRARIQHSIAVLEL